MKVDKIGKNILNRFGFPSYFVVFNYHQLENLVKTKRANVWSKNLDFSRELNLVSNFHRMEFFGKTNFDPLHFDEIFLTSIDEKEQNFRSPHFSTSLDTKGLDTDT